eukprot:jgi/Ulvmu1/851/UM100_0002.1
MADSRFQLELEPYGYRLNKNLGGRKQKKTNLVFSAFDKSNAPVIIRMYDLAAIGDSRKVCQKLLRHSSLVHPHLVTLRSLVRSDHYLCLVTDAVAGGDIFSMVRRNAPAALQPAAARFLVQQLLLAAEFLQRFGLHIADVNPSDFLVEWNPHGLPIIKVAAVRLERDGGEARVATMMSCPQRVCRARVQPIGEAEEQYACAADAWAVAVVFYFMLYGKWPFSREQIQGWGRTGQFHMTVAFEAANGSAPPPEFVQLLRNVFSCGSLRAAEFAQRCPSVSELLKSRAILEDMPAGAEDMTDMYTTRTESRRSLKHFMELESRIQGSMVSTHSAAASLMTPSPMQPRMHGPSPAQHHHRYQTRQYPVA